MQPLPKTAAIIGTGTVGASTAYTLLLKSLFTRILLSDIDEQRCKGELLDLGDATGYSQTTAIQQVSVANTAQADIIIICAGKGQNPEQPRSELLKINSMIVSNILTQLGTLNTKTIVIVVTNPVDTLAYLAYHQSTRSPNLIIGTGTIIDSNRFSSAIAREVSINQKSISALVIGQHGDLQMPVLSQANIMGNNFTQSPFNTQIDLKNIVKKTSNRVYEIINCKGHTCWAIAATIADICACILFDQKRILPISTYLEEHDIYASVPTTVGANGAEKIIMPAMNAAEKVQFSGIIQTLQTLKNQALAYISS